MSVFITSDLHLGHELASKCRGFANTTEHDDYIIKILKIQCFNKRMLLWILGDVAMKMEALDRLSEIPCEKRLVRGNHDTFKDNVYRKYFTKIHGFLRYKSMWLSHCPIHPQEMYRCKGNVHGHIHMNTQSPLLPYPYFNVNWDFHARAIPLDEIKLWFDEQGRDKS